MSEEASESRAETEVTAREGGGARNERPSVRDANG